MSMETFICQKCKRQGCWTEEGEYDYVCKCGYSVQVEPQLTELSQADLIAKLYKTEHERNMALMRIAELESCRPQADWSAAARDAQSQPSAPDPIPDIPLSPTEAMYQAAYEAWQDGLKTRVETPELIENNPEFRWRKPFCRTWQAMRNAYLRQCMEANRLTEAPPSPVPSQEPAVPVNELEKLMEQLRANNVDRPCYCAHCTNMRHACADRLSAIVKEWEK